MQAIDYQNMFVSPQKPTKRRVGSTFGPQFIQALRDCANYTGGHSVYICSLTIDSIDEQGAEKIAWLRKNAWSSGAIPKREEVRGALGEWMILRRLSQLEHVQAVSLVSMEPVCEPDLIILKDSVNNFPQVNIDIKTTAAKSPPSAHYNLIGNHVKGMPHFLVAVLATKKAPDRYLDLYFVNGSHAFTPQQWIAGRQQLDLSCKVLTSKTSESIGLADAFRQVR